MLHHLRALLGQGVPGNPNTLILGSSQRFEITYAQFRVATAAFLKDTSPEIAEEERWNSASPMIK